MERRYCKIYSLIVEGESDITGHIAYSLYKSDKAKYIDHFIKTKGRNPTDEDLEAFHDIKSQPDCVRNYRLVASYIIGSFIDNSLSESIRNAEKDCQDRHADILRDVIKPLQPPSKTRMFWHGVLQSIVGAFFFALIVAAFMFIKSNRGTDNPFTDGDNIETETTVSTDSISYEHPPTTDNRL